MSDFGMFWLSLGVGAAFGVLIAAALKKLP